MTILCLVGMCKGGKSTLGYLYTIYITPIEYLYIADSGNSQQYESHWIDSSDVDSLMICLLLIGTSGSEGYKPSRSKTIQYKKKMIIDLQSYNTNELFV